jgi:hypothetical protein
MTRLAKVSPDAWRPTDVGIVDPADLDANVKALLAEP